jgi:hypothetical protein
MVKANGVISHDVNPNKHYSQNGINPEQRANSTLSPIQGSIYWIIPALPRRGEYQPMSFRGKKYAKEKRKKGKM